MNVDLGGGVYIDTAGCSHNAEKEDIKKPSNAIISQVLREFHAEKLAEQNKDKKSETKKKDIFDKFSQDMQWNLQPNGKRTPAVLIDPRVDLIDDKVGVEAALKKSKVLDPAFETLHAIPGYHDSDKQLKEQRKKEREKTKGGKWFNMPATEVTEEVKRDLEVLQMRSVLDPKHFYKKNDLKVLPKYFQIGQVQDSALEYHNRLTKKDRKRTLVDELVSDAEFNKYNKKKYNEIILEKEKTHYKAYKAAKKLKRKNKK